MFTKLIRTTGSTEGEGLKETKKCPKKQSARPTSEMEEVEVYLMYHIDEVLGVASTKVTDCLYLVLAREDRRNQTNDFLRKEGTTDQASAGWCVQVEGNG
jgi:hypothetical protein